MRLTTLSDLRRLRLLGGGVVGFAAFSPALAQVRKKMNVHGIKSFRPPRHQYPHPYGIIGASGSAFISISPTLDVTKAGYNGLKTALYLMKAGRGDTIRILRNLHVTQDCTILKWCRRAMTCFELWHNIFREDGQNDFTIFDRYDKAVRTGQVPQLCSSSGMLIGWWSCMAGKCE